MFIPHIPPELILRWLMKLWLNRHFQLIGRIFILTLVTLTAIACAGDWGKAFEPNSLVSFAGLKREGNMKAEWQYYLHRDFSKAEIESLLGVWKESGMFAQVQVEGGRDTYLILGEDVKALEALEKGKIPKGWNPREKTTLEEVMFLAPLDIVSARGRAKKLFDFDYKWEVYVPAPKRRWG